MLSVAGIEGTINMAKNKVERRIPFDQPIKILLLAFHAIGFSGWVGGMRRVAAAIFSSREK